MEGELEGMARGREESGSGKKRALWEYDRKVREAEELRRGGGRS